LNQSLILTRHLTPCTCRTLVIIFGATLLPFGYIPGFRKMRIILTIGVLGTL
jgi:hypothetical protein